MYLTLGCINVACGQYHNDYKGGKVSTYPLTVGWLIVHILIINFAHVGRLERP